MEHLKYGGRQDGTNALINAQQLFAEEVGGGVYLSPQVGVRKFLSLLVVTIYGHPTVHCPEVTT